MWRIEGKRWDEGSEEKRAKVGVKATRTAIEPPDGDQAEGAEIPGANYGHEPLLPPGIEQWLRGHGAELGICLFLVVATVAVFGRTVGHEFVAYDDDDYVYENRHVTRRADARRGSAGPSRTSIRRTGTR